jgi:hypothetical protein
LARVVVVRRCEVREAREVVANIEKVGANIENLN